MLYPFEVRDNAGVVARAEAVAQGAIFAEQVDNAAESFRNNIEDSSRQVPWHFLFEGCDPAASCPYDFARVRCEPASHDLHKCGFACPVSADKADPFSALDLEGNTVEKIEAAECDPHLL